MSLYTKNEWKDFRTQIIELDGYKCKECGRTELEVVLQVHHKQYIKGRLPWEYPLQDCETLCKGCHSSKHGITRPNIGWIFIAQEDLGGLNGTCEACGTTIRHSFLIQHENWGTIEVGTICCDKLTDSNMASNMIETQSSFLSRRKRFLSSKRWKCEEGIYTIKQGSFEIFVQDRGDYYTIKVHGEQSNKKYSTLEEAKSKVFDVIDSGKFHEYLVKHNKTLSTSSKKNRRSAASI